MTTFSKLTNHHRLVNILVGLVVLGIVSVWTWELMLTLGDITKRQDKTTLTYQNELLRQKTEDVRDTFNELFQSTRTISLLPMVRSVSGENRWHRGVCRLTPISPCSRFTPIWPILSVCLRCITCSMVLIRRDTCRFSCTTT